MTKSISLILAILIVAGGCSQQTSRTNNAAQNDALLRMQTSYQPPMASDEPAPTVPDDVLPPHLLHWTERSGPAYPGKPLRSMWQDALELPEILLSNTKATATAPTTWIAALTVAALTITLHNTNVDNRLARRYARKGRTLNDFWDNLGDRGGNAGTHFALGGVMYVTSVLLDDEYHYQTSRTLVQALSLNGLTTIALKGIVNRERPVGSKYAWPSGHASSTFTLATVMYDRYGPVVGIPLYAFGGFVG